MATTTYPAVIGVRDFVYAILTDSTDIVGGTPAYGTLYSIPGLKQANYQAAGSMTRLYGDNGVFAAAETVGEQSLSIDLASIPPQDRNRLLGHTYTNGVLVQSSADTSPNVAVGFKLTLDSGASGYVWFPKVKFMKPSQDATTKEASVNYQTQMLEGAIQNLIANSVYRTSVRTDDAAATSSTLTNWFLQPVINATADLGALNAVASKVSTNWVWTFTKTGGGNVTLTQADFTTVNVPIFKTGSTTPIAGTYVITNNGTATVTVTFTPGVAFGTAFVGSNISGVKDSNGVTVTQAVGLITYP